jgi:hypothetical protein
MDNAIRNGKQERIWHLIELLPHLASHDLPTPFIGHSNSHLISLAKNCSFKVLRPFPTLNSYWLAQGSLPTTTLLTSVPVSSTQATLYLEDVSMFSQNA